MPVRPEPCLEDGVLQALQNSHDGGLEPLLFLQKALNHQHELVEADIQLRQNLLNGDVVSLKQERIFHQLPARRRKGRKGRKRKQILTGTRKVVTAVEQAKRERRKSGSFRRALRLPLPPSLAFSRRNSFSSASTYNFPLSSATFLDAEDSDEEQSSSGKEGIKRRQ